MSAVASGRQRQLLSEAQKVVGELKELPPNGTASNAQDPSLAKLAKLSRLVKRIRDDTASFADASMRSMWEQRSLWMHQELVQLTAERLTAVDPAEYWDKVVSLMYASAEQHLSVSKDKAALESRVDDLTEELEASKKRAAELEERIASHSCASTAEDAGALSQEVLELRTKLLVAQQELQRRASDSREIEHRTETWSNEREELRRRLQQLEDERARERQAGGRQSEVITTLMQESEGLKRHLEGALSRCAELEGHQRTLSVNLENHARVVEKLIELNAELMDSANTRAFGKDLHEGREGDCESPSKVDAAEPRSRPVAAEGSPSLGEAFKSFLVDDFEPPRQADANSLLAFPPETDGDGSGGATGRVAVKKLLGGWSGALSKAAAYVSGSDVAGEREGLPVSTSAPAWEAAPQGDVV
uniref:Uncharacterized protein n=1 Tax=Tetraselmis sp. GSL018 TaxID=582737 RepID=A0A061S1R3_9CHLO